MLLSIIKKTSIIVVLFLTACTTTNDQTAYEIIRLNRMVNNLQGDVSHLKREVKPGKGNMISNIRGSQADISKKINDLENHMQSLTGRYEERSHNIDKFVEENNTDRDVMRAEIASIDSRLNAIEDALARQGIKISRRPSYGAPARSFSGSGSSGITRAPKVETVTPREGSYRQPESASFDERDMAKTIYDEAIKDLNVGEYSIARKKLENIVKKYPNSKYVGNSYFLIAETYYKDGRYEEAIVSYQDLIKRHSDSKKVPEAKYKQGISFMEIKDKDTAVTIFEQIVNDFPGTKEAEKARIKLRSLTNTAAPDSGSLEEQGASYGQT